MLFTSDSACVATEDMVEADLSFDVQSFVENPCISEDGFNPLPNWPNNDAAPEALVGLNLETLPSQSGNLNDGRNELGFSPFPRLVKTEPIPGAFARLAGF